MKRINEESRLPVEEGPSNRNESEVKFYAEELFSHLQPLDLFMVDLHHHCPKKYLRLTVLFKPAHGMIFMDLHHPYPKNYLHDDL